jgi:transcriptional regulator with XRE-family HTH domain
MSTITLGAAIGLSFQQIQKYETGINRIGASHLYDICKVLKISVSFVFEGSPGLTLIENKLPQYFVDFMHSAEGAQLVAAFSRITDPELRRSIVHMIKNISMRSKPSDDVPQLKEPGKRG